EKRERYQEERERILTMIAEGRITADEADRLFESLERETAFITCPHCGGEIKAEARKCKHCHKWLVDETGDPRRFTRSEDRVLMGVCGGLARYFNIDPTLVRVGVAIIVFFSGIITGLIIYLIVGLITPEN
ncbi:MAG: PspC domain-containing protein, partial [Verrucomicrobiota bacterium]